MKKNIIIISIIIIAAILVRFIMSSYGQMMQKIALSKKGSPKVTITKVEEAPVIKQYDAPGRIVSKYRVDVVARIEGYLTKSYFKEGDYVKKGQTLFLIEPQEWQYDVQKAQANAANTRAQLIYAEKQLKRGAILVKKDYIAKAEYDNLISQRDALKSQLSAYNAEIKDTKRKLGYTQVKAPVEGQVGIITLTVGNYVNQSTGVLTTINSTNPIYVTFPMDSKEFIQLTQNESNNAKRKVELTFPTGEKYKYDGYQDFKDNNIDESTGTITLRATFPNQEGRLINGEFVTVKMYASTPIMQPIVPQTAVLENPQGKYVYTLNGNIPRITMVKTAGQYKNNWIIEDGLKVGDIILTSGLQKVIPDQPVTVVDATQEKAPVKAKTSFLGKIKNTIKKIIHKK